MQLGNHRQPDAEKDQRQQTTTDALDASQTVSLNTQQAGQQLGVDGRTIRRWITEGLRAADGTVLHLEARQVRTGRGPEWQIYQTDLEQFKRERDHLATEGQSSGQIARSENPNQALAIQIISAELERQAQALVEAQKMITDYQARIEQLALQAGRESGRNELLEENVKQLQQRITELTSERDQWQQKAQKARSYRIRLFPIADD